MAICLFAPIPCLHRACKKPVKSRNRCGKYYSPGVKNYKFAEVLRNNVLWNTDNKSNLAVGKGGGFFSVLEGVASGLAKHNQAKAEEKRQHYCEFEQIKPGIRWTMRDSCNDGQRIQYRFFARQNNQKKGVWPSNNKVYWTSGSETATLTYALLFEITTGYATARNPTAQVGVSAFAEIKGVPTVACLARNMENHTC